MTESQEALRLFFLFLMVITRIVGFFVQAPIWGSHHFDKKVLAAMTVFMAIIVFPNIPMPKHIPMDMFPFFLMIVSQFIVGLAIGFTSFMIMAVSQFGGELLDTQMGLSVAASFDPASGGSTNMMRRINFYLCMLIYLCFDGHHFLIRALFRSFDVVPLTGVNISQDLIFKLMHMTSQIFSLGIQIASPALAALFITQAALGLLARVAPQMNVFMLSFPLNIAVGMTLFCSSLGVLAMTYHRLFMQNNDDVMYVIRLMVPTAPK